MRYSVRSQKPKIVFYRTPNRSRRRSCTAGGEEGAGGNSAAAAGDRTSVASPAGAWRTGSGDGTRTDRTGSAARRRRTDRNQRRRAGG